MPITYTIEPGRRFVHAVWTGRVTADELRAHWDRMNADDEARAVGCSLVDVRAATVAFNGDELHRLVETVLHPALAATPWANAIVVNELVQLGSARQFGVYAEGTIRVRIFREIDEAVAWLVAGAR